MHKEMNINSLIKPTKQTICNPENGNCFQACIASILHLDLDTVPHFYGEENYDENIDSIALVVEIQVRQFFQMFGFDIITVSWEGESGLPYPQGLCIVDGDSPNFEGATHSVIYFNGKPLFDPSPTNKFLKGEPKYWKLITAMYPIRQKIGV